MIPKNIIILAGGESSEKEASVMTGECVYKAIQTLGCKSELRTIHKFKDVFELDFSENIFVFLALHGGYGEDGSIQALLSAMDIPYNGAKHIASGIGMNKFLTKDIAYSLEIKTPKYIYLDLNDNKSLSYKLIVGKLGSPFVIKPTSQGCSMGTFLVEDEETYLKLLKRTIAYGNDVLIEEFIRGTEITIGLLAEEILPILGVSYECNIFDEESKFASKYHLYEAVSLPQDIHNYIEKISLNLFEKIGIRDYGQLNFILDANNTPYLLEINTLPGLTQNSLYTKACDLKNIQYNEMIEKIIITSVTDPSKKI